MSERGFVAPFGYALGGADLVAPVWHASLLELLFDDDLDLFPLVDPRLRVVALSDALQFRLHLCLVSVFSASFGVISALRLTCFSF